MEKNKKGFMPKFMYGLADIYGGGAFVIISTFFIVFLTDAIGMESHLAGTIPLVGKIWDAITDPLMGNITDRTKSKYGAKRFYLLIGSFISAITFALLWMPFASAVMAQYIFYLLMYVLFSTGFTIVMVPYNALLPDMVEDYKERASFSGIRTACSAFGAIIAGLIPTLMIKKTNDARSYFVVALLFSVVFLVTILLTFVGTWEKEKEPVKVSVKESFIQSFTVYKCRAFRIFLLIFLLGQGSADFVQGMALYYLKEVLNAYGNGEFTLLMGVLLIAQFIGTVAFTPVMKATSKKFPILAAFPVRIVATIALFFFSYEGVAFPIILTLSFIIGVGMAASTATIYAILADMADVDELITSVNRPGVCSAMATFIRKIANGFSVYIIGVLLSLVNYDSARATNEIRQTVETQMGIKNIFIMAPLVLMTLCLIVTIFFPVRKKEFDVVKKEIARRKGEDTSVATAEEIAICEKVTGYKYDRLFNKDNAVKMRVKA